MSSGKTFAFHTEWYGPEPITFTWALVACFILLKVVNTGTTLLGDRRLTFPFYNLIVSTIILALWWKPAIEVISGEEPFTRYQDIGGPLAMIIVHYATELFARPDISPMLSLHHIVTILMALYGMTMRNEAQIRLMILYIFFAVLEQPCYFAVIAYRFASPPLNKISLILARRIIQLSAAVYTGTRLLNFAFCVWWMAKEASLYPTDFWVVWPCFLFMISLAQGYTLVALVAISRRVDKYRTDLQVHPRKDISSDTLVDLPSAEEQQQPEPIIEEIALPCTSSEAPKASPAQKRSGRALEKFAPPLFSLLVVALVIAAALLYPYKTHEVSWVHAADGTGNHLTYFNSGKANGVYDYRNSTFPSTVGLPSPRVLSAALFDRKHHQIVNDGNALSVFHVLFGQFVSHDAMDTEETTERIGEIADTQMPVYKRTGKNQATPWLDLSNVYGPDPLSLRQEGQSCLLDLVKVARVDHRYRQSPILTAYHIIFARQHNRLCSDEGLTFDQARDANIAIYQRIVQMEYAPGYTSDGFIRYRIRPFPEYDITTRDFKVPASFSLLYRLHGMMPDTLNLVETNGTEVGTYTLGEAFYNSTILEKYGLDAVVRGAAKTPAIQMGRGYPDSLRNDKFDLAAIDIQRSREMGLPLYQDLRRMYGLPPLKNMEELTPNTYITQKLTEIYGTIDKVEGFVGAMLEHPRAGNSFGDVAAVNILVTAIKIIKNDRLSFPNIEISLRDAEWADRLNGLAYGRPVEKVLADTTGIGRVGNAFVVAN